MRRTDIRPPGLSILRHDLIADVLDQARLDVAQAVRQLAVLVQELLQAENGRGRAGWLENGTHSTPVLVLSLLQA